MERARRKAKRMAKQVVVQNAGQPNGTIGRQGLVTKCGICGDKTHNRRTCPMNPLNQETEEHVEVPPPNAEKGAKKRKQSVAVTRSQHESITTTRVTRSAVLKGFRYPIPRTQESVSCPAAKTNEVVKRRKLDVKIQGLKEHANSNDKGKGKTVDASHATEAVSKSVGNSVDASHQVEPVKIQSKNTTKVVSKDKAHTTTKGKAAKSTDNVVQSSAKSKVNDKAKTLVDQVKKPVDNTSKIKGKEIAAKEADSLQTSKIILPQITTKWQTRGASTIESSSQQGGQSVWKKPDPKKSIFGPEVPKCIQ